MKVFIHVNSEWIPYSINGHVALEWFSMMWFEIIYIKSVVELETSKDYIFIWWINETRYWLNLLKIPLEEIDYPLELKEFWGRNITLTTIDKVKKYPFFIKPLKWKEFNWSGINNEEDYFQKVIIPLSEKNLELYWKTIDIKKGIELLWNIKVWISDSIDFISEWRVFIKEWEILDWKHYKGDWLISPDKDTVIKMVYALWLKYHWYALDVWVTKEWKTLLVEVNDWYSLWTYWLESLKYCNLLLARYKQLLKKED